MTWTIQAGDASENLRLHATAINYVAKLPARRQRLIVRVASAQFLRALAEIAVNALYGNIHYAPSVVPILRRYKNAIRILASRKSSAERRREELLANIRLIKALMDGYVETPAQA